MRADGGVTSLVEVDAVASVGSPSFESMHIDIRSIALSLALVAAPSAAAGTVFSDATFDLFDNGVANLDIVGVQVTNSGADITFTVETRGYANWTKYLFFFNTGAADQTGTNGWNRPVNLNGQTIDRFIGSWVDQGSDNSQFWSWNGAWNLDFTFSNDQSDTANNKVSWTFSLAALGVGFGDVLLFDVGTSGGGDQDTTVDLLSREDQATDWWTNPATAGAYRAYTIVPGPGSLAIGACAAALLRRRRRN